MVTLKRTFDYQNDLPSLPIPLLESTKTKLLDWMDPLVDGEQFQTTSDVVHRFFEKDGEAEKLQEKLYQWDKAQRGSWLKPLWDSMYLGSRDALPYHSNFNILLDNKPYKSRYTTSELVANVSFLVAELYHAIIDEEIEPENVRGQWLDMSQYKNFFRSIRIPKLEKDTFHVAEFDKRNNHVVILYKNNVYKLEVTNDEEVMYNRSAMSDAIEAMIQADDPTGVNVGLLTTTNRDVAAKAYNMLRVDNAAILQTIADSLVVISIDEESKTSEEALKNLMLNANNKYFDKTIQIVVTKQHELGFNLEHCAVDGTSISAVVRHISRGLQGNVPQTVGTSGTPTVEKQTWILNKEMVNKLTQLEENQLQQRENYHLEYKIFTDYGADEIEKLNFSPNSFFHLALQVAQYRTYGKLRSVYEPVAVRHFNEGRTECSRSTSVKKLEFIEMLESGRASDESLYSSMQEASVAHSERISVCQQGLGVERHMYGLEQMYHLFGRELGLTQLPEIFSDKGYLTMRHDFISTSGMAYEGVKYRIFAPVVSDGHGVPYILLGDSITFNISSYTNNKSNGRKLMEHLVDALHELRKIAKRGKQIVMIKN